MIEVRWPDGKVTCPTCGAEKVTYLAKQRRWKCYGKHPKPQFSVKVGTIFEDSSLGLDKWMMAMWLIANCKNGVSSCEVARDLGVTQKSAWHMLQRIRLAMRVGSFEMLSGHVEIDETFIGGKARNMHRSTLAKRVAEFATPHTGRNQNIGKVAVMGLLERNGEVRTMVIPNTKRRALHGEVSKHVEAGSMVYSDALRSYNKLNEEYIHNVINHAVEYVRGNVHTNGIENFWSLLKRSLGSTYISVEPFTFSVTLTNRRSVSITASSPIAKDLKSFRSKSSDGVLPTRNLPEKPHATRESYLIGCLPVADEKVRTIRS